MEIQVQEQYSHIVVCFSHYQYQLIEMLVQQVALDQHNYYPEEFSDNIFEFNVHSLIPKFSKNEEDDTSVKRRFSTGKHDDSIHASAKRCFI